MSAQPLGPFKLVTVNTAPERAKRLIGRVVEAVKDKYTIIHSGNADSKMTLSWNRDFFPLTCSVQTRNKFVLLLKSTSQTFL